MDLISRANHELPRQGRGLPVAPMSHRILAALGVVVSAPSALLLSPLLSLRRKRLVDGMGQMFIYRSFVARSAVAGLLARVSFAHLFWPSVAVLSGRMAWVGGSASGAWLPPHGLPAGVVTPTRIRARTGIDFSDPIAADAQYARQRSPLRDLMLAMRYVAVSALSGRADGQGHDMLRIGPVFVDNVTQAQAVDWITARLASRIPQLPAQVSFINAHCVNVAHRDPVYRRAVLQSDLALPDGIGVRLAGLVLGKPVRQNVNGTDLIEPLCAALARSGKRVYFLGGRPGVADAAAGALRERHPALQVAGCHHGYFSADERAGVLAQVRAARADLLVVAMGVPMQEQFLADHLVATGASVGLGVGGLFDFLSRRIPRAPHWLRELGLEWTWRLAQEPRRMWQRYLLGNFTFMARVTTQRLLRQS